MCVIIWNRNHLVPGEKTDSLHDLPMDAITVTVARNLVADRRTTSMARTGASVSQCARNVICKMWKPING